MAPILFQSKNNVTVRITEQTMHHMKAHHIELDFLEEAISLANINDVRSWIGMVDLGRVVGFDHKVAVAPVDIDQPTLFAYRHNRRRPSHTTVSVDPKPTSIITLVVNDFGQQSRTLVSAWTGTIAAPEPKALQSKAHLDYWREHALIWDKDNFAGEPFTSTWREVLIQKKLDPVAM